jgi:hypothetical protein
MPAHLFLGAVRDLQRRLEIHIAAAQIPGEQVAEQGPGREPRVIVIGVRASYPGAFMAEPSR